MLAGFIKDFDITKIKGADYNPRQIDEESLRLLRESVSKLGIVKPIIVRGDTIVAGHQRTKSLLASGINTAPVFILKTDANKYDEMRFNQLHNGTDLDIGDENVTISGLDALGYTEIKYKNITGNLKAQGFAVRQEICKLILKYGNWGACVATQSGKVIHAAQYALACLMLKTECRVYVIPDERADEYRFYLNKEYGKFNYDGLEKNTFVQTFAQMYRLRGGVRDNKSPTYENFMIPFLTNNKSARVLDFGCGQGDYVKMLQKQGFNIIGIEFFNRKDGKSLDIAKTNRMVDALIESIKKDGLFDAVICDYVLNSVDSVEAENDVLNCLSAFCKVGGKVFFSGRTKERIDSQMKLKSVTTSKRTVRFVEFLDENGFSALYRQGYWFYQKFHSKQDVEALCKKQSFRLDKYETTATTFNASTTKIANLDKTALLGSLEREFNMKYNENGTIRLNRHNDIKGVMECLLN